MKCPDLDRLVDLATGLAPDVEVEAHLLLCAECWADVETIRELRKACFWAKEFRLWEWGSTKGGPMFQS